ncbi:MAG: alpha/beta hydrolase-fold protein [Solirubrobacteraceae bacterium]
MRRRLIVAVAAAWIGLGAFGTWSYGHDYWAYRGFPPPHNPPGVTAGRTEHVSFFSPSLRQRRSYDIYLPPGYAAATARGQRLRVLYLLHGSPGQQILFFNAGRLGVALDTLISKRAVRPFLVVMPDGHDGTYRSDTEWANTAHGAYESFVLDTVHAVDARWPTRADRTARAIAGNSEGAYGAINIALHHLDTFSVAQSWSGYFTQTRTGVYKGASPATLRAASPAAYVGALRPQLSRYPLHAVLYGGRKDPGTRQLPGFAAALRAAGADVVSATYPGRHDWKLWRSQMPHMLRLLDVGMTAR